MNAAEDEGENGGERQHEEPRKDPGGASGEGSGEDSGEDSGGVPERLIVAGLFALSLLVRGGAALQTAAIFNDGPSFLRVAGQIVQGEWVEALSHHYHPLYPAVTALLAPIVGDLERAGVWVSIVAGSAAVVPLYAFVSSAFDRRTAWIAGVLFALHPYAAIFSADVESEGLYFALFLGCFSCLWRAIENRSATFAALGGALAGAAYLVRPEGLGLVVAAGGFAALLLFQGRWRVPEFGRFGAALLLGAAVVAGPYMVHLHQVTGEWVLTQKKSISDLTQPSEPDGVRAPGVPDRQRWRSPPMTRRPASPPAARQAGLLPARIDFEPKSVSALVDLVLVSVSAFGPLLLGLAILGILALREPLGDRGRFLLLVLALYGIVLYGLALNVGYLNRRHVLAPMLPLLGYAAVGLPVAGRLLWRAIRPRADTRRGHPGVLLGIGLVALVTLPKTLAPHREERRATRAAAEWLAADAGLEGPVAAWKFRTAYYAGEAFITVDRAGENGSAAALRRAGARFLIVDDVQKRALPDLVSGTPSPRELYRVEEGGRTGFVYLLEQLEDPAPGTAKTAAEAATTAPDEPQEGPAEIRVAR